MIKNQILGLLAVTTIAFTACDNDGKVKGFTKLESGVEYCIYKDEPGDKHPEVNDMVTMHLTIKVKDSVFRDSRKMNNNQPFELPLPAPGYQGDWIEVMQYLTVGDSAVIRVPIDTIKKHTSGQFPEFVKDGDMLEYTVELVDFKSTKEANAKQLKIDDQKLQAYFAENNLTAQKTESGLYYIIDKKGNGKQVEEGDLVTVDYVGKGLDGTLFDSNILEEFNHVQPFTFVAGQGQVIPGWDEGIQLLSKGTKARLFIPSTLAYGQQELPRVGANAILVFEVEIKAVEDAPDMSQQMPVQ